MTSPSKGVLRDRARGMRKQLSAAESTVWGIVRDRRLTFKFRRQFPIDRYIADFACGEARLVIEVDGSSHDVEGQASRDFGRDAHLEDLGWCVLRLRDGLVLSDPAAAADLIRQALAR